MATKTDNYAIIALGGKQYRVREELQAQLDGRLLAGPADLGDARSLLRRPGEAAVAGASRPAPCHDRARAGMSEVDEETSLFVQHLRPHGHRELDALPVGSALVLALTVNAAAAFEPALALEEGEVTAVGVGYEDDVAAVAAVAPVGASPRHVLLAPEAERAVAAAAASHLDPGAIVEHALG